MRKRKLLLLLICLVGGLGMAVGQTLQVRGIVVSGDNDEPVIGASVVVQGGRNAGVITDFEGRFSLKVEAGAMLRFSYIGMKARELPAEAEMMVRLESDAEVLDEVVVTGYGNVKKSSYTGSASVMSTEKQKDLPVVSITQMMEGNLSGVNISTASGQPGAGTSIRIRGYGSITASNEPLYVLDGVPIQSGSMSADAMNTSGFDILSTLNPADIENITILKDAASASLYGARGANGVVLITTKRGKEGATSYSVKASFGISDFAYRFRPTMGGDERRELVYEGLVNGQLDQGLSQAEATQYADANIDTYAAKPVGGGKYSDWMDELFRKALQQNYDFSIRGGNENTQFNASVGYVNQENVARNAGFERYSGHLNLTNKYKRFDFAMNAIVSLTKSRPMSGAWYYANPLYAAKYALTPSTPIYNEDGSYNTEIQLLGNTNPAKESSLNIHKSELARAFASAEIGYTIVDGLRLSTLFNADYTHTRDFTYFSPLSTDGKLNNGEGTTYNIANLTWNWNTRLGYIRKFGLHTIDALAAYEVHKWEKEYASGYAKNYSTSKKPVLDNASEVAGVGQYIDNDAMISYVVRLNYDYADKYYVTGSFRRDGSSRLDPDHRWANFWAVSASWRFTQEQFMQSLSSWLTDGKLRLSYGVNGNIPNGLYSYNGFYSLGYIYNDQPGIVETALVNPTLSWEKNYALNAGFDLQLFGRVNISFDWYKRKTKDLLLSRQLDPITGFGSITDNIGRMENKGFEVEIASTNIDRGNFLWTTSFNLSHNKNKVVELADVEEYYSNSYYIVKEGYSLGTIALREYAGVDPENGKPMYYSNIPDENGVPSRELVSDPNEAVSVPLADIYPKYTGGLTNTFRYGLADLSFNLTYSFGGHSYDAAMPDLQNDGYNLWTNYSTELRDRWREPGDVTDVPRFVEGQSYGGWWHSSRGVHSTNHIRLKSLTVGVSAPVKWLDKLGFSTLRLYFSGTNLLTWAKYDQYDPELQGTVGYEIPPLRTYSFGLEIGF